MKRDKLLLVRGQTRYDSLTCSAFLFISYPRKNPGTKDEFLVDVGCNISSSICLIYKKIFPKGLENLIKSDVNKHISQHITLNRSGIY